MNSLINNIANWFSSFNKTSSSATNILEEPNPNSKEPTSMDNFKDAGLSDTFTSEEFSYENLSLNLNLIWKMGDQLSAVGYRDGESGQADTNIKVLALTLVDNFGSLLSKKFLAKKTSTEAELESIEKQKKLASELQEQKKEYRIFLEQEKEIHPNKFSAFLGWFYIFISVLLIFADLPLALSLTRDAFDLKYEESLILCFGIALCTVIFKIVYDEFITSPLEIFANQLNRATNNDKLSTGQKFRIKLNQIIKILVKIAVLAFTIYTIVLLAKLRFLTITVVDDKSPFLKDPGLTIAAFIVITIIFPLVGGICMSLGLHILNNIRSYKQSKIDFNEASETFADVVSKSRSLQETVETCKKNIEYCTNQDFEDKYTNYFIARYRHGFRRGFIGPIHERIRPDKENDLFAKAEALYFKKIAENVTFDLDKMQNI